MVFQFDEEVPHESLMEFVATLRAQIEEGGIVIICLSLD